MKLAASSDFIVRSATDDDINYVRKTWLDCHASNSSWIDVVDVDVYFREHPNLRDSAIDRGAVTIACRPSVLEGICGFAVSEAAHSEFGRYLHFVYVKERWRGLGVAKLLLRPLLDRDVVYTHRVRSLDVSRLPKNWRFNPYPFLRG